MFIARRTRLTNARRAARAITFACAVLIAAAGMAAPAAAEPVELRSRAVALNLTDPAQTRVGALEYRGGLVLSAADRRFGGLSGLHINEDGTRITAVSDRGHWFTARLLYDGDGWLTGADDGDMVPILDDHGHRVTHRQRDAEEIAALADGRLLVSFERNHRIRAYGGSGPATASRAGAFGTPPDLGSAPSNGGIEAMTELPGGRILILTEKARAAGGGVRGWLLPPGGGVGEALRYLPATDFYPTSAAVLPGGDVLVLERRFTLIAGSGARLVRLPAASIVPGAVLEGVELARLESPVVTDNFEGLALRRNEAGETLVYLVSDDNFAPFQRTLLLQFRLIGQP